MTGKEKAISLPSTLLGTIHDNGNGKPWWYKFQTNPTQPTYAMVDIGYNDITIKCYRVDGTLVTDVNGNITVKPQGTQTKAQFDTLTINYADRV